MNRITGRGRTLLRKTVRPVVGQSAWQFAHDVKSSVHKVRVARTAPPPRKVAPKKAAPPAKNRKSLTDLARKFQTDKWGRHRYTPHYELHLKHLRDKPIKLLEIGIGGYNRAGQGGASLRMWRQYFPKATIVGLDIEDKSHVQASRIRIYQGSQTDPELLHRMHEEVGPFDVIIDDGSHRSEHIRASFDILFPLLKPDGIYVVEDVQTSYWPERGGSDDIADPNTSMALLKSLCDGLNYEEFVDESYVPTYSDLHVIGLHFYHNMVVIEKGTNREGTARRRILKARYAAEAPTVEAAAP